MLIHIKTNKVVDLSRAQIEERGGNMAEFREVSSVPSHKGHEFFRVDQRAVMK